MFYWKALCTNIIKLGDNIYKSIIYLSISLIVLGFCYVAHKKNNPKKKVLIPYDMV